MLSLSRQFLSEKNMKNQNNRMFVKVLVVEMLTIRVS